MWGCESYLAYNKWHTRINPLRCIMSKKDEQLIYFENMSRATAIIATGIPTVMHRDIMEYPTNTIWGRVEKPALISGGICSEVNQFVFVKLVANRV